MGANGIEVTQQNHVPFGVGLLDIHQHLLYHGLGPSVGVGTLALRTLLGNGDDGGVAINGSARGEDDVLATMLAHHVNKHKHAVHVCFVVHERLFNRLPNSLETCKVDDSVNLMLCEDLVHGSTVANVGFNKCDFMSDDFLDATDGLGLGIIEIINDNHAVACLV